MPDVLHDQPLHARLLDDASERARAEGRGGALHQRTTSSVFSMR
jgi:hypothetical protein